MDPKSRLMQASARTRLKFATVAMAVLCLIPLAGKATEEECNLYHQNHFDVSFYWATESPIGDRAIGFNASIVDNQLCWAGVSRSTLDTRIIPRGVQAVRVGYSPYWPCSPDCYGQPDACYAGSTLSLRLDGLGWNGANVTMTCDGRDRNFYALERLDIPEAPVMSGSLKLTVVDDQGSLDHMTFRVR